jgi:hypothetical protein
MQKNPGFCGQIREPIKSVTQRQTERQNKLGFSYVNCMWL